MTPHTDTDNSIAASRGQFATRFAVIATTVGSAVGLGNIWRFPYEAGTHCGGAFMLLYIAFIFIIGVPVLTAEFIMGRSTRSNIFGAYRALAPGRPWYLAGYIGIVASMTIISFYSVVAGWTLEYFIESITGSLSGLDSGQYHSRFLALASDGVRPVLWTILFLALNFVIVARGVNKGIERISNLLMPTLFVLLIVFCIRSLTFSGASEGLRFLFSPDFSQITPSVALGAMGQAFFTLSLGLGCMATYGSYFSSRTPLLRSAVTTASLDTLVAILSGIIIFPAVFTFGVSPAAGPTLIFEVLPSIFHSLPLGPLWSALFFFLLILASLTSTISMSETAIAFFIEERGMSRRTATMTNATVALVFGTLCALSFGPLDGFRIFSLNIFDAFDYLSSNILLPAGGLIISIFTGWVIPRHILREQLSPARRITLTALTILLRYIAPTGIILVFLRSTGII